MKLKRLKHKVNLFVVKYLNYIIYRNYKLRPNGFTNVKNYIENSEENIYYEVYPDRTSKLKITEQQLKDSSKFINYQLSAVESSKYILKINKGRILTDFLWTIAIFDENDRIIDEISLDLFLKNGQSIKDSRIHKRKYFPKVKYFRGTVFHTIAGGGSYINYGHWILDSISRIHILKESGLFDEVDWFYVPTIKFDYQIDSLKALGIPEEKIIDSKVYPHICADTILASSHARGKHYHIPEWIIDFCRKEFPPKRKPKFSSKRYFISRKDSGIRNIINEDEISDFLSDYEFETVILSKLTFQEKIDLFAHADVIISMFGAGLTNLIFCKERTTVVELFGDQFVDFTYYYDISTKRNLNYHYLVGKSVTEVKNSTNGHHGDIQIDKHLFKDLLEHELSIPSSISN